MVRQRSEASSGRQIGLATRRHVIKCKNTLS